MKQPNIQIRNMLWDFHLYDVDPKPSVPHGHSLEGNFRLSIWDGKVYEKARSNAALK